MSEIAADNVGFVECWNEILTPKWIRFRHLLSGNGKIHSDIERGFIRVEVISYDDFVEAGSEKEAKQRGHVRQNGRDYVMQDGDICHFLFNV